MVIYYFVSLDKPEFTEYAKKLCSKTNLSRCFAVAWWLVLGDANLVNDVNGEYQKLRTFLQEHCKRNKWDLTEWLKTQSKVKNPLITNCFEI